MVWYTIFNFHYRLFVLICFIDGFFTGKMLLYWLVASDNGKIYLLIFIAAISFILIPLWCNIWQLQHEIKGWTNSNDNCNRQVSHWIKSRVKIIYILTFISGSAFSTIALCNSYLFQVEIFSMGLSRKQRATFQNKRIYSTVLLEVM